MHHWVRQLDVSPATSRWAVEVYVSPVGLLVDSEIVLSTRYGKTRVFMNKTLSTETVYQPDLINRDLLSTRFDSW